MMTRDTENQIAIILIKWGSVYAVFMTLTVILYPTIDVFYVLKLIPVWVFCTGFSAMISIMATKRREWKREDPEAYAMVRHFPWPKIRETK